MLIFNFGRKVRRVARRQYRRGKLDRQTYNKLVNESKRPEAVARWKVAVESQVRGAPWLQEPDEEPSSLMERIWAWFLANWPAILKIILTLLMFVDEAPKEDEKTEEEE